MRFLPVARIVVLDADAEHRASTCASLTELGLLQVVQAATLKEAQQLGQEHPVDLCVVHARGFEARATDDGKKIFPNPFKDQFTVLIKPGNTSTGTFELYDAGGKLYFQKRVPLQKDVIQLIHFGQIQPLQRGLYVLKFSDRTSAESFKLMVD